VLAEMPLRSAAVRDERDFLDQLSRGDGASLAAVVGYFGPMVERLVSRRFPRSIRHRVCPGDVVQIAFFEFVLQVRQAVYHFGCLADVQAMLMTIAFDKLRQQLRDHRRACRNVDREAALRRYSAAEGIEDVACSRSDPFLAAATEDWWEAFLNKLPLLHQTIVQLRAEGYSVAEIAVVVEHSRRFVQQVLAGARRRLSTATV